MWSWGGADVSVFTRVSGLGATLGYDGALRARNVRLAGQVHVNYRMATFEDVPRLAAARWAFRRESGEAPVETETAFAGRFERFAREALASGRWTYWIAETDDGTLTSQMAVCVVDSVPRPSRASDQWGYLTDCYTSPAFRNEGLVASSWLVSRRGRNRGISSFCSSGRVTSRSASMRAPGSIGMKKFACFVCEGTTPLPDPSDGPRSIVALYAIRPTHPPAGDHRELESCERRAAVRSRRDEARLHADHHDERDRRRVR